MTDMTQDEWDRCRHCGAVLRLPPWCCSEMMEEYHSEQDARLDLIDPNEMANR